MYMHSESKEGMKNVKSLSDHITALAAPQLKIHMRLT